MIENIARALDPHDVAKLYLVISSTRGGTNLIAQDCTYTSNPAIYLLLNFFKQSRLQSQCSEHCNPSPNSNICDQSQWQSHVSPSAYIIRGHEKFLMCSSAGQALKPLSRASRSLIYIYVVCVSVVPDSRLSNKFERQGFVSNQYSSAIPWQYVAG